MRNGQKGFTLIEILIGTLIGMFVIAAAYGLYTLQTRSLVVVDDDTQSLQNARMTLEQLSRELRMASFGVVGAETFTDAKTATVSFLGDIDSDINASLAQIANAGDTQIFVDLKDSKDSIDSSDFIFLNQGEFVEMKRVRQTGDIVSMDGEPDKIYLQTGLTNSFLAGITLIKTVETTTYSYSYGSQTLSKNGRTLSTGVSKFELHYFNDIGEEMVPEALQSLTQIQRAGIRKVEIVLETKGRREGGNVKSYTVSVELRNMGTKSFGLDVCKPNPPTYYQVTDVGTCGHFTASWTPPSANACDGSPLTDLGGFKIGFGTASDEYFVPSFNVSDETAVEYQVEDVRLENGQTYYTSIQAYDTSFNESDASAEVSFTLNDTTRPDAPEGMNASASVGTVALTWTQPDTVDVEGYRIYRSTVADFTPDASNRIADETSLEKTDTSFTDSSATACQMYYYKISAVDCGGEGTSSAAVFGDGSGTQTDSPSPGVTNTKSTESPATPPATVNPFGATAGDRNVRLSWTNPTDSDLDHVIVRYSTVSYPTTTSTGEELVTITCQPGATGSFDHSGLVNSTTYYYSAFACDRCGNCSSAKQISATPSARSPVVEILYPTAGQVITNGKLIYQARAYDPDELTLSASPNVTTDNGKGISYIQFNVTPHPVSYEWPSYEYLTEYCGLSGNTNPCPEGDISDWCSGTYNLNVIAVDNDGQQTQSPYRQITVQSGGLELDSTYTVNLTGSYKQIVNFRLKNTAATAAKIKSLTATWNRSQARLAAVRIPSTTAVWGSSDSGYPGVSGAEVDITSTYEPTIAAGSTAVAQFEFMYFYTNLSSSAAIGATYISVASTSGFTAGDAIYIGTDSGQETVTIASVSAGMLNLSTPLTKAHSYNERVTRVADLSDIPMSGVQILFNLDYEMATYGRECATDTISVIVSSAPVYGTAFQDEPAVDTVMSTSIGLIHVMNYRSVPIHLPVTDYSGYGISGVKMYYYVDASHLSAAPSSGYANISLTYNTSELEWLGTIPFATNSRIWIYFIATDGNGATERNPASGGFTYDLDPDTTAPACPLGLVATKYSKKEVKLQWTRNTEPDLAGYNIYRRQDCGSWAKKYTLVSDQDSGTPDVVDYTDTATTLDSDKYCYGYYIQAVDTSGNGSSDCSIYLSSAGDCPCP